MKTSALILFFCVVLSSFPATAANVTWTGASGDWLWNTDGNWDTGTAPTASDTAIVNAGTLETPVLQVAGADSTIGTILIGDSATESGTVTVEGALTALADGTAPVVVGSSGTGLLVISNGGMVTNTSQARYTTDYKTLDMDEWDKANHIVTANGLTSDTNWQFGTFAIVGTMPSTCVLIR